MEPERPSGEEEDTAGGVIPAEPAPDEGNGPAAPSDDDELDEEEES